MLIDASQIAADSQLESDVCVVGAGAAGIPLALTLADSGVDVLLVEGGLMHADEAHQELYRGRASGPIGDDYLHTSRLRQFGGTTGHWNGMCARLEPGDFANRAWLPHSGWPISHDDLTTHYEDAGGWLGLGRDEFEPPVGLDAVFDTEDLRQVVWRIRAARFAQEYRDRIATHSRVRVIVDANVVHIQLNSSGRSVASLTLRTLAEQRFSVRAREYVIACGGIENARLLLSARDVQRNGIGNTHDLVGRFYMDHAEAYAARLTSRVPNLRHNLRPDRRGKVLLKPAFALQPSVQAQNETLGVAFALRPEQDFAEPLDRAVVEFWQRLHKGRPDRGPTRDGRAIRYGIYARFEQSPNPSSRVTLSREIDRLGMPRVKLDWVLADIDRESVKRSTVLVARSLGQRGVGAVRLERWLRQSGDDTETGSNESWPPERIQPGFHHMGTTRMNSSPRGGVVDPNCQVHGVSNLFLAGSSVFPTSGWANPTWTIVALAVRLARHLMTRA